MPPFMRKNHSKYIHRFFSKRVTIEKTKVEDGGANDATGDSEDSDEVEEKSKSLT